MNCRVIALVAVSAVTALPAFAGEVFNVAPFKGIELHGGGTAILRHGAQQRVTLLEGDPKIVQIAVNPDGTLDLSPCKLNWGCPWQTKLKVEVVTPGITAVAVHGGGDLTASGEFPRQPSLAVSVHGGGEADLRAIPADTISASVHGGGEAMLRAERQLTASVHGGGSVTYWGHPTLTSDVHGGGSVQQGN